MDESSTYLNSVFDGWAGYNSSLIGALRRRTPAELTWSPNPGMRSCGEIARHIALGRIIWFLRMDAPGSHEVAALIPAWETDEEGNRDAVESALDIIQDSELLVEWLQRSWQMVEATLATWTVADLAVPFSHKWDGKLWSIPRQWTIFRILAHDIHHGGELSLMLGLQGIEAFELGSLGGHVVLPPLASDSASV